MSPRRPRLARLLPAALAALLAGVGPAQADDDPPAGTIGLLMLPGVFGSQPCVRFTPVALTVYAAPGASDKLARLESRPADATSQECLPVLAESHFGDGSHGRLPSLEASYEEPAAIVLEQRGEWFRVALSRGDGWVHPGASGEFRPLPRLLQDSIVYFTAAWDGRLYDTPNGRSQGLADHNTTELRLRESRVLQGRLWLHLEVPPESCGGAQPQAGRHGWVPAQDGRGRLNVWFYARGC